MKALCGAVGVAVVRLEEAAWRFLAALCDGEPLLWRPASIDDNNGWLEGPPVKLIHWLQQVGPSPIRSAVLFSSSAPEYAAAFWDAADRRPGATLVLFMIDSYLARRTAGDG
jgi:hypothetical protein